MIAHIATQLGPSFDLAEQVGPDGVRLHHDGRPPGLRVVHEDVAAEGPERIRLGTGGGQGKRHVGLLVALPEHVDVGQRELPQLLQESNEPRVGLVL